MKRTGVLVAVLFVLGGRLASPQAVQNVVLRNSFNPLGAGARGLGMGGAFVAVADDGTAASFNPAGLAQLRRTELALVGFTDLLHSELRVPRGEQVETTTFETRHHRPDFVGLSVPFGVGGRQLTIELSYQRAVDLFGRGKAIVQDTIDLADLDPDLRGVGDFIADIEPEQTGAFHTASLAAGYQLTSRLSVGAALNYWIAEWTARGTDSFRLRVRIPGGRTAVEVPLFNNAFDQAQSMRGLNVNAGILLRYPRLSLGAVFRLPFSGDYNLLESDVQTTFEMGRPLPPTETSFSVTSRLHWPRSTGVGIALRPVKGLTLAGDYSRSHWSRTVIDDVPNGALLTRSQFDPDGNRAETFTNRNFFDLLPASQTVTSDTSQWRAGGEYLVTFIPKVVIPLRGGAFRDRSPVTEFGTDQGKEIRGVTFGTGLNFSRVVLDVAFERRRSDGRVALRLRQGQEVQAGNLSTETVREDRIVGSLIYRFGGDDDPLKRALRYLFVGPREGQD